MTELRSLIEKAGRGAGLPNGLERDLARASLLLCGAKADGCAEAANALQLFSELESEHPNILAVLKGPSFFELMFIQEDTHQIQSFQALDSPALLMAMGHSAYLDYGLISQISWAEGQYATNEPLDKITQSLPGKNHEIALQFLGKISRSTNRNPQQASAIETTSHSHARLSAFAAKTYVPATDDSRLKGAGAGLNDND